MGRAHLELGQPEQARAHFEAAAARLADLPPGPYADWLRLCIARGLRTTARSAGQPDPVLVLLRGLCERADLESLGLLLPLYLGNLHRPEDEDRLTTALRMLHAERRLADAEQEALGGVIALRVRAAPGVG